jgi:hypothetical protein
LPGFKENGAAHGLNHFFPKELLGCMVLGLINVSLQRNNYRNAFFIIQGGPQLYKSLSVNQMVSEIIDNNGRD